ncbi:hypothetical protein [Phytohabitans kaempferiae]|uniref:Uncharacterized protein n=1 Tax=Phytohabitans kaempferiae TaxID=1620943 RepID=A0ABV6M9E0_9ACTN
MKTTAAIWSWSVDARVAPARLCATLEVVLARPVVPLGAADPARLPADAVICDVWHTSGDFPTIVECYGPPAGVAEMAVVAAVARRLGHRCLVADDTLNPERHLLAAPDGTLRPAHVDVADTEDGAAHSNARPCTIATQRCRESEECRQSRWEPDLIVAVPDLALA